MITKYFVLYFVADIKKQKFKIMFYVSRSRNKNNKNIITILENAILDRQKTSKRKGENKKRIK